MQSDTYLERYRSGEYEQVWSELVALGDGIRDATLYSDASAVAAELMGRVKANIETVIARLRTLNYRFAHPANLYSPPAPDVPERMAKTEHLAVRFRSRCGHGMRSWVVST